MAAHFPLLAGVTLLLLLCLSPTLTIAEDDDLVLDIERNPVEVDSEYYILPVGFGFHGGITTSPRPGSELQCPLYVVQSLSETDNGKPVRFIPTDSTQNHIHLSSDLLINSGFSAYCRDDGLWKMAINGLSRRFEVVANGAYGLSPANFHIRKGVRFGGYVLSYCPHVVDRRLRQDQDPLVALRLRNDQDQCDDLGVITDDFIFKVLGVPASAIDGALEVVFLKKNTDDNLAHRAAH